MKMKISEKSRLCDNLHYWIRFDKYYISNCKYVDRIYFLNLVSCGIIKLLFNIKWVILFNLIEIIKTNWLKKENVSVIFLVTIH